MQEMHHRVKNSLQLVRGILSLQARRVTQQEAKDALNAAATRIVTIAEVHQNLYQGTSVSEVDVSLYLNELAKDLTHSILEGGHKRSLQVSADAVMWPSAKAISLGIITTELITNAIKYGLGKVNIKFKAHNDGTHTLSV